jgi:hypothetical protein
VGVIRPLKETKNTVLQEERYSHFSARATPTLVLPPPPLKGVEVRGGSAGCGYSTEGHTDCAYRTKGARVGRDSAPPEKQRGDAFEDTIREVRGRAGRALRDVARPREARGAARRLRRSGRRGAAEQFGRVEALLQGLEYTAEVSLGIGASLVFGDAKDAALTAKTLCEMRIE